MVSEQAADIDRMVSHTSRYASVVALLAEQTANHSLGAIARRSWDWASYMSDASGRVVVGGAANAWGPGGPEDPLDPLQIGNAP